MLSLLLRKTPGDSYHQDTFNGTPLDELALFLDEDARQGIEFDDCFDPETTFFISWLKDADSQNDWTGGNTMELKKQGNRVSVAFQYRKNKGDWSKAFTTSRQNMIQILHAWYELMAMQPLPDEILVMQEGEKVVFLPKFFSEIQAHETGLVGAIALKR